MQLDGKEVYGKLLVIDLKNCDTRYFTRKYLQLYFDELCGRINMHQCEMHFWDDEGVPEELKQTEDHTTGISAVQFILTSNITVHTLSKLNKAFIDIFSCKDFDAHDAIFFTTQFFEGEVSQKPTILARV